MIFYIYILQILPQRESEDKYYGKDEAYDKEVKNKINRKDSLLSLGPLDYKNGTIHVITPCSDTKY